MKFCCKEELFSSLIYSVLSAWTHRYLLYSVGYDPLVSLFILLLICPRFGSLGLPLVGSHVFSACLHQLGGTFSLFGSISVPSVGIASLPEQPWSFNWRVGLETDTWAPGVLLAAVLIAPFSRQSWQVSAHTHTHLYLFLCLSVKSSVSWSHLTPWPSSWVFLLVGYPSPAARSLAVNSPRCLFAQSWYTLVDKF